MNYFKQTIQEYINKKEFDDLFDGSDYEQGKLEDLEGTIKKLMVFNSELLVFLLKKDIMTNDDVFNIFDEMRNR